MSLQRVGRVQRQAGRRGRGPSAGGRRRCRERDSRARGSCAMRRAAGRRDRMEGLSEIAIEGVIEGVSEIEMAGEMLEERDGRRGEEEERRWMSKSNQI